MKFRSYRIFLLWTEWVVSWASGSHRFVEHLSVFTVVVHECYDASFDYKLNFSHGCKPRTKPATVSTDFTKLDVVGKHEVRLAALTQHLGSVQSNYFSDLSRLSRPKSTFAQQQSEPLYSERSEIVLGTSAWSVSQRSLHSSNEMRLAHGTLLRTSYK